MHRISQFFKKLSDWLFVGKRLPIIIAAFILIACVVTVAVVMHVNGVGDNKVTAYVTVKGFGEDVDFENRQIRIEDGISLKEIFSYDYEDIYASFGKPLIEYNEFKSFLGVKKSNGRGFQVSIDGIFTSNLDQAYVYEGQTVVIEYI